MWFLDAHLGGSRVDLQVVGARIATRVPVGEGRPAPEDQVVRGGTLSPPFAEPHVHLDAVLLGTRAPNITGTLREGIRNWAALRGALTPEDVYERASTVLGWYAGWGTTRVRTHVDTGCPAAVEALVQLRDDLRRGGLGAASGAGGFPVELQVVAFPQEGILRAPGRREGWLGALDAGCDVVGVIPHFERTAEEGWRSVHLAFEVAVARGLRVDLHCDETDDPGSRNLEVACAEALDRGHAAAFPGGGGVVAGHCTALHSYPNPHAAKVCELVAAAGVIVVANPLDNVVLQGRYDRYPRRRGLTRVDELWDARAAVGIGHDSVMDPWYRLGTANLVDAAAMLVHVGQLTGEAEMVRVFETLSTVNHRPFGAPPSLGVGEAATLLHFDVADPVEVLRLRPRPRVWVRGEEWTARLPEPGRIGGGPRVE
jgi:cytosine deaminase